MNLPLNEIAGPEVSPLLRKAIERTMWDAMNFNLYNELPKHLREYIDDSEYPQQQTMRYALLRNLNKVYRKGNFSEAQWDTAQELEAGMSTEFGKLVKVSNYETLNRVVVTTNIMQFELWHTRTVVVYN